MTKIHHPSTFLPFIEKMLELINKYSIVKIFKALFVVVISVIVLYVIFNPEKIFERAMAMIEATHNKKIELRKTVDKFVNSEITTALQQFQANRVLVMEYHNGSNNLSGLPFLYFTCRYERVYNTFNVDTDYDKVPTNKYPFISYVDQYNIWIGDMNELATIDTRLAAKMKENNTEYMAIISLKTVKKKIGLFCVTYDHIPNIDQKNLKNNLNQYSNKISQLLDGNI